MKRTYVLAFLLAFAMTMQAQIEERSLSHFKKVVVHPYIDVEMEPGSQPGIVVEANGIDLEDIITETRGKTLQVYLRGARTNKIQTIDWKRFEHVDVKVYITYPELRKLSLRGDGMTRMIGPLHGEKFTLKLFGDQEVDIAAMELDWLKTVIYGEADLRILAGHAYFQKWKIFGEADVDALGLEGDEGKVRVFGQSDMKLNLTHHLGCTIFGESKIRYKGNPSLSNVILGDGNVKRVH